ncbi:uncharacterized protein LOC133504823 isoform X2 [Syngnathoides biaculeatus]|uniref:uncharacterized protein LOC133504823 isoform X2 n=1 Tax=Syngnathoides biaculeatus TaxID=300417 RepID=UPI002ADE2E7B|nr:uncharacterized protein LOC133504823 isoform X2 [Syngnathoides biaculeatus]
MCSIQLQRRPSLSRSPPALYQQPTTASSHFRTSDGRASVDLCRRFADNQAASLSCSRDGRASPNLRRCFATNQATTATSPDALSAQSAAGSKAMIFEIMDLMDRIQRQLNILVPGWPQRFRVHAAEKINPQSSQAHVAVATNPLPSQPHIAVATDPATEPSPRHGGN